MKSIIKTALFIWTILLVGSCHTNTAEETGTLSGKISIGPICPVESIPPNPACLPTQATYDNWPVYVWSMDKKEKIALLQPLLNGIYTLKLPVGNYIIDLDKQHIFGKNVPTTLSIKSNETTVFDVNIDTGIR